VSKVINKYFHEVSESEFFQYSLKNCEIAEFEF